MQIPQGTQPGAEFRLRGQGVPHIHSDRRGDLRVFVDLSVPKGLNSKQKQLLKQLAKSMGHDDIDGPDEAEEQPKSKGIFDRVKDSFT